MSKDAINPKRYILTQEQIDAYKNWILDRNHIFRVYGDDYESVCQWEKNHPCPIPNPVEIWYDNQIEIYNGSGVIGSVEETEAWIKGAKFMRDLIFNKQ